jgi:hypothetical protein
MAKTPKTPVAQLVADLGGVQAVAEKLNTKPRTIRMWEYRKAVPRRVWPEFIEAFPAVTMDTLMAVERAA